ncbi:hypothetical protein [Candidatus Cryosericum terrychapinii]|uniref:Primosomal protein N' 3' DNA-binding domain-containing protein n=1 Tax=Candidatus Cryosericum terrychapinii TaxID=2290919 RepID=A0A398CRY6_9BACT|nr:hypothetical protein [Candidatus Cryosericum terrychapinii]RIE06186.1 hypothetical protein SMC7_03370 [Candidatus Cryosericum terrychapinii]
MIGSFAVLTQRGPFSRNLLAYDLGSVEDKPEPGTWFLVPFVHDVAPALLVSTSVLEGPWSETGALPLPALSVCSAPGIYPALGPDVAALQHSLERQVLGWEDALAIVRFLQASQPHDRNKARLTAPEPALLLHNLQVMAAQDPSFSTTTAPVRQLLADTEATAHLQSALWKLSTPARRKLYEQGFVVDGGLAGTEPRVSGAWSDHNDPQLIVGSFVDRATRFRPAIEAAIAGGGSVALIVSSDVLASLYEGLLSRDWSIPVVRWPSVGARRFRGDRHSTVWLSTRQFSSLILPEIALVAVDLGIPGEWPFFWQHFSLRSLLSVAADMSKVHGIPCLAGVSAPTLSVLDACGVPTDSALGSEVENPAHVSATFVLRSQNAASEKQTGPSGVLLAPTMRLLRQTYDQGKDSMLLLNIRGFATLIECAECGYTATCPDCGATLTLGGDRKRLFCKQCGHSEAPPDLCPNCQGTQLRSRGYGLDRLARELQRTFPVSAVQLMIPSDDTVIQQNTGPSLFLGTYADAQRIAVLKPALVVFPDVSVGLRHPVFDNIEQLAVVVRGAVAETAPGTVLIQLDRRSTGLRSVLDGTETMAVFLENEREQRRELLMPPFARQFVVRVSSRGTSPDVDAISRDLGTALAAEGVDFRGLHADLLTVSARARVLSLEFRADSLQAALGLRVGTALARNRHFQNAAIRVY